MSVAYIGIGSNLGDRQKNIEIAIEKLKLRKNIELREVSAIIETEAVGDTARPDSAAQPADRASQPPDTAQPKFLNACCRLETLLYPDELLDCLKSIERELGRRENSSALRINRDEQLKMLQEGSLKFEEAGLKQQDPSSAKNKQRAEKPKKWGPRPIDLDILFYDDVVVKGNNLIIPHPLLHKRPFVLKPLAEIAPDFIHPVLKKSINDLLLEFGAQNGEDRPQTEGGGLVSGPEAAEQGLENESS